MEIQIKDNKIYAPLKNKWLVLTPEERVRQEYIRRLIDYYGFTTDQMEQEIQVNNSHRGQGKARADIVIWKSATDKTDESSAVIVVECKAEHITIREEDYFQGYNYAAWAGADFFVTTNLKETRVFRVVKGKLPKRLEEIVDIPQANDLNNAKKIKELLSQTKAFTRDEFSRLLFKCHNIIRNNDKLSPEAAFDEISKVLFIKIRYERDNTGTQIFSKTEFKKLREAYDKTKSQQSLPFYQQLFERTKEDFANDNLFESNDTIKIKEASFEAIVKELEIYNLSRTADDIKGIAFEKFLGKTFRGELGQFFTPRTIVDFMVSLLDPEEGEIICDPCCGSGGFLIKAFEYVREKIENNIQEVKEQIKAQMFDESYESLSEKNRALIDKRVNEYFTRLNQELDTTQDNSRLKNLSHNCIFGTDANPRMARTAKMNMIMHGDGHGGVHHHDGLLNVNGIFENRFDVIFTNPPFGARVEKSLKITEADKFADEDKIKYYTERYGSEYTKAIEQVNSHIGESVLNLYDSGKLSGLTEVLFIERCLRLLKPGGRLGIVLPEGVLNNTNLQNVRELFESMAKIILITSIPQDVFMASGATVKPSLVFFKKFTDDEATKYEQAKTKAYLQVTNKYSEHIACLKAFIENKENPRTEITAKKAELKALEAKINEEAKPIIKQFFNYQIPIAQVQMAGITSTGTECKNELVNLLKEYTPYRQDNKLWKATSLHYEYKVEENHLYKKLNDGQWKKNMLNATKHITTVPFSGLINWSVQYLNDSKIAFNKAYPMMRIGEFLKRNKTTIVIQEEVEYKRVTIKIRNGGVVPRDVVMGRNIGTKKQFKVKEGQFIISKIDARNGAMGIIPEELDGAVVTPDFLTYDIDTTKVNPQYLVLVCTTKRFIEFCQSCSSRTTNRQRINETQFLSIKIPIPSLEKQNKFVEEYNRQILSALNSKKQIAIKYNDINTLIFNDLDIVTSKETILRRLSTVPFSSLDRWDISYLQNNFKFKAKYKTVTFKECISHFMKSPDGKTLRIKTYKSPSEYFHYIGMENIEKVTGQLIDVPLIKGSQIKSQTVIIPKGYFIYGKLRPYLNKYWYNDTNLDDIVGSSELFVFKINDNISTHFFKFVLGSNIVQEQIANLTSGARMPRINEETFMNIQIPVPPIEIQQNIISKINTITNDISKLKKDASQKCAKALTDFESKIFE